MGREAGAIICILLLLLGGAPAHGQAQPAAAPAERPVQQVLFATFMDVCGRPSIGLEEAAAIARVRGWTRLGLARPGRDRDVVPGAPSARWMVDMRDGAVAWMGRVSNVDEDDLPSGFGGVQLEFSEEASPDQFVCRVTYQSAGKDAVARDAAVHEALTNSLTEAFGTPTAGAEVALLWESAFKGKASPEAGYVHQGLMSKLPPGVEISPPGRMPDSLKIAVAYALVRMPPSQEFDGRF